MRDIHRRVGTAILFESSGGQVEKVAHLPELRFALGEPEVETTTVDSMANALEARSFFVRKASAADGYVIHHQATLKKVVSDRRASLDEETEVRPAIRQACRKRVQSRCDRSGCLLPAGQQLLFRTHRASLLVVLDPEMEWQGSRVVERIGRWTRERGSSPRLYPGSLVWCGRRPGRELRDKVEMWLAWRRVETEVRGGVLGSEFDSSDRSEVRTSVREAEQAAKDEVWAAYRFVALADNHESNGLKIIDLGAGHSSASETLCGRIISALKTEALLNESVGAGYIDRHWPPAFNEAATWPLPSLRQSFLTGALTRLIDPDAILRRQIVDFVSRGDFGLGSGAKPDGGFERLWYREPVLSGGSGL